MVGCHRIEIANGAEDVFRTVKIPWVACAAVSSQTQNIENTGYIIMFAFGSFLLVFFLSTSDCLRVRMSLVFYLLMVFKIGRVCRFRTRELSLD